MVVGEVGAFKAAQILLVVEGTAVNGLYLDELLSTYIIPLLEHLTQRSLEGYDYFTENPNIQCGLVIYHASDRHQGLSPESYGPFLNPCKLISVLRNYEFVGGRAETCAHIAAGLATALQCFEDFQSKQGIDSTPEKYCILVCNSPQYEMPLFGLEFPGKTANELAAMLNDREIKLSILAPRRIPALFKLFEMAGGNVQENLIKSSAKDPRHMILLQGCSLGDQLLGSVGLSAQQHPQCTQQNTLPVQKKENSELVSSSVQPVTCSTNIKSSLVTQQPSNEHTQWLATLIHQSSLSQNLQQQYIHQSGESSTQPSQQTTKEHTQWLPTLPHQSSSPQKMQQQYIHQSHESSTQPSQQTSTQLLEMQHGQNSLESAANFPNTTNPTTQSFGFTTHQRNVSYLSESNIVQNSKIDTCQQRQQTMYVPTSCQFEAPTVGASDSMMKMETSSASALNQHHNIQLPKCQPSTSSQLIQLSPSQRPSCRYAASTNAVVEKLSDKETSAKSQIKSTLIWRGNLEWFEKLKSGQTVVNELPFFIATNDPDNLQSLNPSFWPKKVTLRIIPKPVAALVCGGIVKNSRNVMVYFGKSPLLEILVSKFHSGNIGCMQFVKQQGSANIPVQVMLLVFSQNKKTFVGLIPNDQSNFLLKMKEAYAHHKSVHGSNQQQSQQPITSHVNTTSSFELCPTNVPRPYLSSTNSGRPQNATQSVSQVMEQAMVSNSNQMSFAQQTHGELVVPQHQGGFRLQTIVKPYTLQHSQQDEIMQQLQKRQRLQQQQMLHQLQHKFVQQRQNQQMIELREQQVLQQQHQQQLESYQYPLQRRLQQLLQNRLQNQQQALTIQSVNANEQQQFGSPQQQGIVPSQQQGTSSSEQQNSSSDHQQHVSFSQQQASSSHFSGQQFNPANFNFNG